ncbi:MAG: ATP-dependent helicase [Lachnospiraceae bacterium]|nr:ATP-dependent helicase [Lachnospiraceae bacterium]
MKADLSSFNASQREAICHGCGPALVLAGPGSGKTTVLTRRLQYLIEETHIPPEKILVVTFTKAAADEMQQRFETLSGAGLPVRFGTFHSVFYSILQENSKENPLSLLSEKEKQEYLRTILRREQLGEERMPELFQTFAAFKGGAEADVSSADEIVQNGLLRKNPAQQNKTLQNNISPEQAARIFEAYRQKCREAHKIDFDDMAYETLRLFTETPDVLKIWQTRFSYIMVDEYQDIAPIQERLLEMLALPEQNLFLVGDDDQCIYGFRGAATELMLSFPQKYPQAKQIVLSTNYRSRRGIIEAASKVISENKSRFAKKQEPARKESAERAVVCQAFPDKAAQQRQILSILLERKRQGVLSQTAVLYRRNADAQALLSELAAHKIPFVQTRRQSLYDHFITADLTSYLRFIYGAHSRKEFYRIMNRPRRGIERESCETETVEFDRLLRYHHYDNDVTNNIRKLASDCSRASKLSLYAAVMYIRKGMGYEAYLQERGADGEAMQCLAQLQELAKGIPDLAEWERMLKSGKEKAKDGCKERAVHTGEGVRVMTYHASKGLEFDCVILPDLNDGCVPYKKAVSKRQIEEERRMFYVAMTRARDRLHLYYRSGTKEEPEAMSRFLKILMQDDA